MFKPYGTNDNSYKTAGEEAGVRRLVSDFYDAMATLPEAKTIWAMHNGEIEVLNDKLARFLCSWLGGPRLYREKYGPISIPAAHSHIPIGAEERDAWLSCMRHALDKQSDYSDDFKAYMLEQLAVPANRCMNKPN